MCPKAAICYGCGRNNEHGLHIKTHWDGEIGHATFIPKPEHTGFPGVVYGGLIASLIDCHSICTAVAQKAKDEKIDINDEIWFVTGTIKVVYLRMINPCSSKIDFYIYDSPLKDMVCSLALIKKYRVKKND